jgi:dihydrofolate reductase
MQITPGESTSREVDAPRLAGAPSVALIAAVAANRIIGARDQLPWLRLADDLRRFRALTVGHTVIMGRKTWETLPGALADRQNIVVTRQRGYVADRAEIAGSFDEALALVRLPEPVFCIGGGELYRVALSRAATLHLTEIARDFEGDAEFPPLADGDWREIAREARTSEGPDGFDYAYVTYERAMRAE